MKVKFYYSQDEVYEKTYTKYGDYFEYIKI